MNRDDATLVTEPRTDTGREWEVFARRDSADPLTHVGSVSAPTADVARDHAESLFGWTAHTVWLCPADEVTRATDRDLGAAYREETAEEVTDA
jgi:rSAM-partnered protein